VFSPALEVILTVAYREAAARRHTHLTLEHLLYALAHDPDGERILAACGADLPQLRRDLDKYLDEHIEQFARGQQKEPDQTMAFRRVLQTAVLHVQSAGRHEVQSGDVLAATLQQSKSYAAQLLAGQGVSRLDVLEYITHGISKVPPASPGGSEAETPSGDADAGLGDRGGATARDPLSASALNLTERAREGALDPLIGRVPELQRTLEILCRRRKNNPVFVGDAGVGKTALAEGLATRLLLDDVPEVLQERKSLTRHGGAARGHASAATSKSASRPSSPRSASARCRFSSSTRSTRPSAPARPRAARWIWRL
jgi:ATP-dependent Clp protease ATP-binding subunit ClpA